MCTSNARWMAIEQSRACATEANEAMMPSPVCFTSRPAWTWQAFADDRVVAAEQGEHRFVADVLCPLRRAFQVGEHDRAEAAIRVAGLGHGLPARKLITPHVHHCVDELGLDLDQFVGDESVRFLVDGVGGVLGRRLDQAEDLPGLLVEPVRDVAGVVFRLRLEIQRVRGDHVVDRRTLGVLVDIHEERHVGSTPAADRGRPDVGEPRRARRVMPSLSGIGWRAGMRAFCGTPLRGAACAILGCVV